MHSARDDAKELALYRQATAAGYASAYGKTGDLLADTHAQGDDPSPVIDAYMLASAHGIGFADSELEPFYRDGRFGLPAAPRAARAHFEAAMARAMSGRLSISPNSLSSAATRRGAAGTGRGRAG